MNWLGDIRRKNPWLLYALLIVLVVALGAFLEFRMGRIPICKCGYVSLWYGSPTGPGNSQHISDWYTFSHIIHGFAFYFIAWLIGRKRGWPLGLRLFLAVLAEVAWEVFENSAFVIDRYRSTTLSLDYYGDSVLNSMMDVLAMIVGFFAAFRLPVWSVIALTLGMELFVAYLIRDNLTLNIIMLIYPFKSILLWQTGGG